jgi:hypothetical protein
MPMIHSLERIICNLSIDIGGEERTLRCQEGCLLSLVGKSDEDRTLSFEFALHTSFEENSQSASDWGEALGICLTSMNEIQRIKSPRAQLAITPVAPIRASSSATSPPSSVVERKITPPADVS